MRLWKGYVSVSPGETDLVEVVIRGETVEVLERGPSYRWQFVESKALRLRAYEAALADIAGRAPALLSPENDD